jgi:hypothetical protein
LISNLGGVTDAEKAPCSLEKILDKLRVPAAIFLRRLAKYELLKVDRFDRNSDHK